MKMFIIFYVCMYVHTHTYTHTELQLIQTNLTIQNFFRLNTENDLKYFKCLLQRSVSTAQVSAYSSARKIISKFRGLKAFKMLDTYLAQLNKINWIKQHLTAAQF